MHDIRTPGRRAGMMPVAAALLSMLAGPAIHADDAASRPTFEDEVTVTGTRDERSLREVPIAIGVIDGDDLKHGREEALDEAIDQIPGVFAASNDGSSDVKISIRGFGARSTFGVRDILVMVDGVSITDADGFTRLDQIDLAAAERVEVLKGPASAIYGNAAFGGVVNVLTEHGTIGERTGRLRLEAGELGFSKALASIAGGSAPKRLAYALYLSRFELTDFRDHNDTETRRANGTVDFFRSERTTVRGLLNLSQMRDEIPGALNRQQLDADPSQSRAFFSLFDWRRDDDRYRLGGVIEHQMGSSSQLEGRLFVLTRDLDHPIFQVIDQQGLRFMGGVRYSRSLDVETAEHRLSFGFDGDREDIDNQRFRNVFGAPGALLVSADEAVENIAFYAQDEIVFGGDWRLSLGARYDSIRFTEDDRLLTDGDQTDSRSFDRVSPKLGLIYQPSDGISGFLSLSTAFQTPTKSELQATVGETGFNRELAPQTARHAELGVRGTAGRLRYEASVYQTDVDDEILPRTVIENTTVFGNVGATRHRGVEVSLDVLLPRVLVLRLGYAFSENTFTDFADVAGNTIPGHPEHQGSITLASQRIDGLNGALTLRRTGSIYLNDANSELQAPFSVLDMMLRYDWQRWSIFVHGGNLTDERYAAWLAVNDPSGNFFLPAKGRNLTAGFDIRF